MITPDQLSPIGVAGKPHGINGEINILIDNDKDVELCDLSCIVMEMDGIFVPFFIDTTRARGVDSFLVKIDGVDNELKAKEFTGKKVYALRREWDDMDSLDPDADGYYASDFIGFKTFDPDNNELGVIEGIEDSTDNVLFIISRPDGKTLYVPVVDEFITDIDIDNRKIELDLPEGLINL